MERINKNADLMNKRNQNQSGQTGGESVKWTRIPVKWMRCKMKTIKETTARTAMSFCRSLTYFFRLRKRTYVCPRHIHSFTYVGSW